ncbi:putative nuclease HARBI1 isoform X1 [Ixodes scapularis]
MAETLALKAPLGIRHKGANTAPKDSRLREAGAEVVYCLTRGAPKGPNLPRVRLNHQDALFPGHGKATHSHTWAGEPAWLGVRGDATLQTPAFTERLYREHRDAFELAEEIFWKQYRLPKIVVRWLCDELREEPEVRRVRTSRTVMTVELQVLCALRFYGTGSFQGMVASDEHVARDQKTVSVAVRAVSVAIVRRLGVQRGWIHFPETPSERFDAEKGFRLLGRIPGVIGCVDGTMVSIVGPSKNDPTVTKAAYWCRKYFYALNVMVVCDADCRIMCIDPRYPGSVHDSFVWQFSWLRNQLEQGQVPRDGRFLLGDSGYPLEPWLITPVPGNHATSTACGRFNKAHSSISAPQHLPCIERARTGVRLRP